MAQGKKVKINAPKQQIGTCKLCLRPNQELQDSHLMPAGMYRRVTSDDPKAPHPVVITELGSQTSCEQVTDYVFCKECEGRFDRGGEDYMLRRVHTHGRFRLLEELNAVKPSFEKLEWRGYKSADTPTIDRKKIGYFAMSVFWRASVHTWRWKLGKPVRINLGAENNETLRRYLMGETDVPASVALFLVVCSDKFTQGSFYMPTLSHKNEFCWNYGFVALGVHFNLIVSKQLPKSATDTCCLKSPEGWLWLRDCEANTVRGFESLLKRQPPTVR